MGLLIDGQWHEQWYETKATQGEFIREESQYRHWITQTGQAGPSGKSGFVAEPNRYHLYVSLACPWAHRTLIFRELKQLQNVISVSVVHPDMMDMGWTFDENFDQATGDSLYQLPYIYQLYTKDNPNYSGRVTVPILWDKQKQCIVNNESSQIIRMLNTAFNHLTGNYDDYYPEHLRGSIDGINELIYQNVNNGVYRAGFATTQKAYGSACKKLFATLDDLDKRLSKKQYLLGREITEADWRLFTTLVRFDVVYVGHFKCNMKRIADYKHLSAYLRELYQYQDVKKTVNIEHIKRHYYFSHTLLNPTQIVPVGPELDLESAHGRNDGSYLG